MPAFGRVEKKRGRIIANPPKAVAAISSSIRDRPMSTPMGGPPTRSGVLIDR